MIISLLIGNVRGCPQKTWEVCSALDEYVLEINPDLKDKVLQESKEKLTYLTDFQWVNIEAPFEEIDKVVNPNPKPITAGVI